MLNDVYQVAKEIRRQIGVESWLAVSAREPQFFLNPEGQPAIRFRFGSRYGLKRYMEIAYRRGTDDYSLWAYKIRRNGDVETIREFGLYCDGLPYFVREINQQEEAA